MNLLQKTTLLTLTTIALTACGAEKPTTKPSAQAEISASQVTSKGAEVASETKNLPSDSPTYSVAVINGFEPYTFRGEDMKFKGFNVDIINAIAAEEGFKVDYVQQTWNPEFTFMKADKIDIMGSIVTITPERQELFDFSQPYIQSSMDLAVKDDLKDKSFKSVLEDTSVTYSIMENTTPEKYALSIGIPKDSIVSAESQFISINDIFNGNATVAMGDKNTLKYYKREFPDLHIIENANAIVDFGFLINKGDTELKVKLDSGLQKVKDNGMYDAIYQNWFGEH